MRLENYNTLFSNFVDEVRLRPFDWGEWDCCIWAADAVEVITGEDKLAIFRGTYNDELSAMKALRRIGEGTLLKTLVKHLGGPIHPAKAILGDVVYYKRIVGICLGEYSLFVGPKGLQRIPTLKMEHAFEIR